MTDNQDLAVLAAAATPGPWRKYDTGSEGCSVVTADPDPDAVRDYNGAALHPKEETAP